MAKKKTWRERWTEVVDGLKDRLQEGLDALDDLLAPPPEPVRVPVASPDRIRRPRR